MVTIRLKDYPANVLGWSITGLNDQGLVAWPAINQHAQLTDIATLDSGTYSSLAINFTGTKAGSRNFSNITLDGDYEYSASTGILTPFGITPNPPEEVNHAGLGIFAGLLALGVIFGAIQGRRKKHG
jgi:hypothetical protein